MVEVSGACVTKMVLSESAVAIQLNCVTMAVHRHFLFVGQTSLPSSN